ncbi:fungal-specific transcription factor domain-containing protein [Exophiala viscosa]|uniref:Fungal-specific transcription factor domain-containing protein n=1 Tax=Exophiala viscosa TaxID=2486360 RepID=A0AAN6DQ04_9EURO|nr:fungal-specific transcription factor domain-containing protein [Exophiala viscosa]KAI1621072.1 fungal-specific transcription factor domain-containing protein [Exophiala viscosa]
MAKQLRSRGGCRECRRMHRKCTEERPNCEYCVKTGKSCSYDKPLKWGGRSFRKSCFGQVLSTGAVVEQSEQGSSTDAFSFVYGPNQLESPKRDPQSPDIAASLLDDTVSSVGQPSSPGTLIVTTSPVGDIPYAGEVSSSLAFTPDVDDTSSIADSVELTSSLDLVSTTRPIQHISGSFELLPNPAWLPWLSNVDRSLLDHFTVTVTNYLSLHQTMQNDFCTVLLPMALDTSHGTHLLSAILGLSAIHQISLGSYADEAYLAQLRFTSLQQLRLQNIGHNASVDEQSIATALMLCLCDILAGGEKPRSWRLHLQGAATMISNYFSNHEPDSGNILVLWRLWKSLQSLSLLLGNSSLETAARPALTLAPPNESHYIDVYDGFSTKLLPVVDEVDTLYAESQALQKLELALGNDDSAVKVLRNAHTTRSEALVAKINSMLDDPVIELDPTSEYSDTSSDFFCLNEAYHVAVLLQVYQRVMNVPITDAAVQSAVKRGVSCLKQITLHDFASPGVATLQPLFIIGCAAHEQEDRLFVMDWVEKMRQRYALRNTDSARDFLLELWQERDSLGSSGPQRQFHQLLGTCIFHVQMLVVVTDIVKAEKEWDLSLW